MGKQTTEARPPQTAMETSAPSKDQFSTLRQLLERSKNQIARCLPNHMDADRMLRITLTTCQRSPTLLTCHPLSIVACTMLASELGLELSGPLGQAFMVPRKNKHTKRMEAVFQVGYRGFHKLAFNSGKCSSFPMHAVYAHDEFDVSFGSDQRIFHKPKLSGDRGPVIGYYAICNMLPAGQDFEYMTQLEMVAHRAKYASTNNIWDSDFEAMALKTCVRRLAKRLPLSTHLVKAAVYDEYEEANVRPIHAGESMAGATHAKLVALKERLAESGTDSLLPDDIILDESEPEPTPAKLAPAAPPSDKGQGTATTPPAPPKEEVPQEPPITDASAAEIAKLFNKSRWTPAVFDGFLLDWGVNDVKSLTEAQAQEVIRTLLKAVGSSGK